MSEQENDEERSPESERARRDVREALVRYVGAKGTAGACSVPAAFANFVGAQLSSLTREGTLTLFGNSTSYRVSDAALAKALAEYAIEFLEGSCGPDVDALSERFAEILAGKAASEENEGEKGEGWFRDRHRREASGVASHPFAKPADDEPSRLDEAIEKARAFVFPALGTGHALLLHWLTELRDRRLRGRDGPPRPPATCDSASADIEQELAETLSLLILDCFAPAKGWASRKASLRGRAIHIYARFRELGELSPEAVVLLDFVHSEILKEAIPPRGGQPIPHA